MESVTIDQLREELAPIRTQLDQLAPMHAHIQGLPLIGHAIEELRREVRLMRAAINDMARTNITAGEVESMHTDIDRMQSKQLDLETRIAMLERQLAELAPK